MIGESGLNCRLVYGATRADSSTVRSFGDNDGFRDLFNYVGDRRSLGIGRISNANRLAKASPIQSIRDKSASDVLIRSCAPHRETRLTMRQRRRRRSRRKRIFTRHWVLSNREGGNRGRNRMEKKKKKKETRERGANRREEGGRERQRRRRGKNMRCSET